MYKPLIHTLEDPAQLAISADVVAYTRFLALVQQLPPRETEIVSAVFDEPGLLRRFLAAPAAERAHHAVSGGLLAHSVDVAVRALRRAESVRWGRRGDRHLIVVGALLHDVGKALEYDVGIRPGEQPRRLAHARFGHHIVTGAILLETAWRRYRTALEEAGLDDAYIVQLQHIILAHHGARSRSSPVAPQTVEARIVYEADSASAAAAGPMWARARHSFRACGYALGERLGMVSRRCTLPGLGQCRGSPVEHVTAGP